MDSAKVVSRNDNPSLFRNSSFHRQTRSSQCHCQTLNERLGAGTSGYSTVVANCFDLEARVKPIGAKSQAKVYPTKESSIDVGCSAAAVPT